MGLRWTGWFCVLLATGSAAPPASAAIALIADGALTGSAAGPNADLSGLTGTLENGLPANLLGGVGSGIAYAGGSTFLEVPDRGPNATHYDSNLADDTVSYINRFQTLTLNLTPSVSGAGLPYALTPTLTATTLLSSPTSLATAAEQASATASTASLRSARGRRRRTPPANSTSPGAPTISIRTGTPAIRTTPASTPS